MKWFMEDIGVVHDIGWGLGCSSRKPTSKSWLRAAIELSSLKSMSDVAKVRRNVPSIKQTELAAFSGTSQTCSVWVLRGVSYLWWHSGTAGGRCHWVPADGRYSEGTAWPHLLHCREPSCCIQTQKRDTSYGPTSMGVPWLRVEALNAMVLCNILPFPSLRRNYP